ncbi:hypothetical protein QYS48_28350 [Marivirga arenosa]|uniref:TonB C-terminal domain-containing protein n=1 Tax=Marivirga arenosa TaxID=3059076 RepID=A0AA51N6W2_9BACT|nr:hypothetical protein [Marivirga sp. ABR2-2]WMN07269.1 hypothetical protein QYS48_28350 [Marivirga sp. ABR2-2]
MRILFFLIFSLHSVLGQDPSDTDSLVNAIDEVTFTVGDDGINRYGTPRDIVSSEFIGGTAHMIKYLYAKMDLVADSAQSNVYVSFTINECGKPYNIEIVKNQAGPSVRDQAEKIIAALNFHPGYNVATNSFRESQRVIPLDFNNDSIRKYENYLVTEAGELSRNYADNFYTGSLTAKERILYQKALEKALSISNNWFVFRQILDDRLPPAVFVQDHNIKRIEYEPEINALRLSEINFSNLTLQFFHIFQDYLFSTEQIIENKSEGYANLLFESKLYHDVIIYYHSQFSKDINDPMLGVDDAYISFLNKITDNKKVIFDRHYKEEFANEYFLQMANYVNSRKDLTLEMIDRSMAPRAFNIAILSSSGMH